MPEENWIAHGGVPACDICHARKVKCDRKDPCSNCVVAKVECQRNRHKRAPKPKVKTDDKIQALVQRLSSLENSVRKTQHGPNGESNNETQPNGAAGRSLVASPERPQKRKRTSSTITTAVPENNPDTTASQPTNEARHLISKELSMNGLLSAHQRSVLETAITFVDHLSHAPVPAISDRSTFGPSMYVPTDLTQDEILHVILGTETPKLDESTIYFASLDHVPPKGVERIALALMEGNCDEKTLMMYKVIIHFKAAVVLYASTMRTPKSAAVQKHIRQLEYDHFVAALTALDSVSFLTTPSLLLLQVLVTGAIVYQVMGNPACCWELISHASRTAVALGYHNISTTEITSETDEEIHAALAWCAHFDSCMSLLLLRPRSLPTLQIKVSSLIKPDMTNPMSIIEIINMDLAPIHDKILDLSIDGGAKKETANLKEDVAWLRTEMSRIYARMDSERPVQLLEKNTDILLHWKCLEFKYFSTLTSVHRLSPSVTTHSYEREECLRSARLALECVNFIEQLGKSLGHFIEGYDPYLAWTMLSYPLCPFFVVFCNVVGTSNAQDFRLLQNVTDGISTLVTENKYVNRLHRLCATLLSLCKPLVAEVGADSYMPTPSSNGMPAQAPAYPPPVAMDLGSGTMGVPNDQFGQDNLALSSWNDDMMWQLFQSQPSLDWFNADILDPL